MNARLAIEFFGFMAEMDEAVEKIKVARSRLNKLRGSLAVEISQGNNDDFNVEMFNQVNTYAKMIGMDEEEVAESAKNDQNA